MNPTLTIALAASYLVGSIPTAYLAVRGVKRIDVRTVGSGNVGATNASRVLGVKGGAAVFVLDMLKGLIAAQVIAPWIIPSASGTVRLACGFAAVLGHNFPVFLGFRGGKGVSTTIGVLAGTMPLVALTAATVGLIVFSRWRYVSVGSMAAAAVLPLVQYGAKQPSQQVLIGALLAVLIIARHHQNIRRLLDGTELPAGRKKA
jgi:glycerol-3-phosphate acyltransferase PlsY